MLQFEILIPGAESLKDKRRVIASLKDRLHREHLISVAEVASQDNPRLARLGLALVATDGKRAGQVLDQISAKLRNIREGQLGDMSRTIIHGDGGDAPEPNPADLDTGLLEQEMQARALRADHS